MCNLTMEGVRVTLGEVKPKHTFAVNYDPIHQTRVFWTSIGNHKYIFVCEQRNGTWILIDAYYTCEQLRANDKELEHPLKYLRDLVSALEKEEVVNTVEM